MAKISHVPVAAIDECALLDSFPDCLVVVERRGRIQWLNPAARQRLACTHGDVAWDVLPELFSPDYLRAWADRRLLTHEKYFPGQDNWQEIQVIPLADGICVALRDITPRKRAEETLRSSEARLRAIYEHGRDAVGVSVGGIHAFVNPAYLSLFGYEAEADLIGLPVLELIAPSAREAMRERIRRRNAGTPLQPIFETRCLRANGTEFEVEMHVSAYEQGGDLYTIVLIRDITERRESETALRDSEKRYRALSENGRVGIWQVALDGQTLYCNPAMRGMLEVGSTEEVVRRDFHEFFTEESRQIMSVEHGRRASGIFSTYEAEIIGAQGGRRSVMISGGPILGEDGTLQSILATFTDITERKRAEAARREAEARYRSVFENAREGLFQTSPEGRLLSANPATAEIFGYDSPEEMTAAITDMAAQMYVNPARRADLTRLLMEHGSVTDFESELRRKDGQAVWISSNIRAIFQENGQLSHYEGSVIEITRRRAEEAERTRRMAHTEGRLSEALQQADLCPLTGLLNHRAFHRRLGEEAETALASGQKLAVAVLDMDNFKFFNDAYGHLAGDDVLRQVADALRAHCRASDTLARFGGDEFALLMPGLGAAEAKAVAARLTQSLDSAGYLPPGVGSPIPLRVSVGLAVFPEEGPTATQTLNLADERLLHSKNGAFADADSERLRAALAGEWAGFSMLDALVTAVDAKDRCTRRHSEEVAAGCLRAAVRMGWNEDAKQAMAMAALLHDVGKIGIPDRILRKPGALTGEELQLVQQHPQMGAAIVGGSPGSGALPAIIRHHHERWDGGGYPAGLRGEDIPLPARLLAVAEGYFTMTADRPYRKGLPPDQAQALLAAGAGTQWDPACVQAFLESLDSAEEGLLTPSPTFHPCLPAGSGKF